MRTANWAAALAALALPALLVPTVACAGPADQVFTPIVDQGEREIEIRAGTAKARDGTRESQYSLGLGLGVNTWWATEFEALLHKQPGARRNFDAWEWENRFQFTETGKYAVDVGALFEIERPQDRSEGYEYRWGPLLQADLTSSLQANLNLLLEKHIRVRQGNPAELGYQWQIKYRWQREFEFGLQGLGDFGPWNKWEPRAEQPHSAGPALFGRITVGNRQAIKYNAALLFGVSRGAPNNTARMQAEYEF